MKFIWGEPFKSWQKQIEVLKTDRPLRLPAVKPLKAKARYPLPAWARGQVVKFRKRGA